MENLGIVSVTGYFTMLKYIVTLDACQLERTLGFEERRLKRGFRLAVLSANEVLTLDDFDLKASTRWSGTYVKAPDLQSKGQDIRDILSGRGQDVRQLKSKVASFFARRGGNTPAKVIPALEHSDGMKYPNAEALGPGKASGAPQFILLNPRNFVVVRHER